MNKVGCLFDENGSFLTKDSEMEEVAYHYFDDLFMSNGSHTTD